MAQALELAVFEPDDIIRAQAAAKRFALELGFDLTAVEEIAIVVCELASNLVRHAQGGRLTLSQAGKDQRSGIRIESSDRGPGIAHVESAMADGFSTSGSLGYGLGTINRLMDEFQITSQPLQGTYILCQKWQHADSPPETACPLEFGVATRPFPGMEVNGDAFVIKHWGSSVLIGVIDGLGGGAWSFAQASSSPMLKQVPGRQRRRKRLLRPDATFAVVPRSCDVDRRLDGRRFTPSPCNDLWQGQKGRGTHE